MNKCRVTQMSLKLETSIQTKQKAGKDKTSN